MNIDDWIEIAEREVDQRVSSARIASINGDGRAEYEEVSWEIKWRIMCGYLYELKARRETEANLVNKMERHREICKVISETENAQSSPYISSYEKEKIKTEGQVLFAKTIGFDHPKTGEYMEFSAELPQWFSEILEKLRRS